MASIDLSRWQVRTGKHETMNPAITAFVEELAADPTTRGVLLFGSQARGTARPDSDADLAIIVDRPGFVMGVAERDGQEFELVHLSEATATAYFSENRDAAADTWSSAKILYDPDGSLARLRDHVAAIVARGKPPLDADPHALSEGRRGRPISGCGRLGSHQRRRCAHVALRTTAGPGRHVLRRSTDVGTAHKATPRRHRVDQPRFARLAQSNLFCGRLHHRKAPPGAPHPSAGVRPVLVDARLRSCATGIVPDWGSRTAAKTRTASLKRSEPRNR